MAIGAWVVEAAIRFSTLGLSSIDRAGVAMNRLQIREAELTGAIDANEAKMRRLGLGYTGLAQQRLNTFSAFSAGVAVTTGATLGYAIDQAANMERALYNLQIATAASKGQMDAFKKSIYDTAAATAQSAPTIASIYGSIASTSGLPASSLTPEFLSKVTRFGEIVQMKSAGTQHEYSALEASTQLIELAHQYRAYTPEQIGTFAEMLHKAIYFMPGGLSQFLTQSKYFTPLMALSAGNTDAMQQSVLLGILLQQTGLGRGRGGTGVAAFERQIIQGLTMTSHAQAGRRAALMAMGLIDSSGNTPFVKTNAQNQTYFDVIGALAQITKYVDQNTKGLTGRAKAHEEEIILRNAFSALGIQGSLIGLVAAGGGVQQMRNVQRRMGNIPSIDKDQQNRLNLFWGAVQRVTSGLGSLGSALGTPGLRELTPGVGKFADAINRATKDLEDHPDKALAIFHFGEILFGLGAIGTATRLVIPAVKFVGTGLKDTASGLMTFGKWADRVFMRGIGSEAVGAMKDLLRAAGPATDGIARLAGALLKFANLWGTIFAAFNNDAPDLRGNHGQNVPEYGSAWYWRAWKKAYIPTGMNDPTRKSINDFDRVVNPPTYLKTKPAPNIVHVGQVNINFPNVTDGQGAKVALTQALTDPRSPLMASSPGIRTHKRLPKPMTTPPR